MKGRAVLTFSYQITANNQSNRYQHPSFAIGLGVGNCSQAGYIGAFCLCAGAAVFNRSAHGAAAGWGYCRARPHVPEQVNLQLADARTLVASFVTFPAPGVGTSTRSKPEVQYWEQHGGTRATSTGVTREWASPAVDYALAYRKPPVSKSMLDQPSRQYLLHFVKL
eukprot:SAG31_NODE_4864_length_2900_cov_1.249554_1_plen_165_part_10